MILQTNLRTDGQQDGWGVSQFFEKGGDNELDQSLRQEG